jgi:hypothetical protein
MLKATSLVLRKWLFPLMGLLAIAYTTICLYLYFRQTRFIFFPQQAIEKTPANFGVAFEEVWLPVSQTEPETRLHGWWMPVQNASSPVLLYLHGNGVNIGANAAHAHRFHQMGFNVLLIDYRGYGLSGGGFPSEDKVYQDAEVAWQHLVSDRQISPERIMIYGHSLGGAVAIDLALRHPDAAGLIVQSSFTSVKDVIDRIGQYALFPVDLLLTQRFQSIQKVPRLQLPVLFIHGMADSEIPADMSESLYAAAPPPKRLWLVPEAGHNNVADVSGQAYFRVIEEFTNSILLVKD